jgi:integrase
LLFGNDDPVFPATNIELDASGSFAAIGLTKNHWSSTEPVRKIFRTAFGRAGVDYFHPHSFRHMLARLGERVCPGPEAFKAWSQNLGHERVMTTFNSYGPVSSWRQAEIIRTLAKPDEP